MDILSLPVGGGDAYSAITTVYTLHLYESTLLLRLIAKADEAVSTRLAGHGIGDDLSRLARGEAELKLRYETEIVHSSGCKNNRHRKRLGPVRTIKI